MFTCFPANGQTVVFKTYTVEDGLVSNPVRRIYQDSKGFIWIATLEGFSKYDSYKFQNYTTANGSSYNMINDIYEAEDGRLYVAENNGATDILQNDAIVSKGVFRKLVINRFSVLQGKRVIAVTDSTGLYELKNQSLIKLQSFGAITYNDLANLNDSLLIGGAEGSIHILNNRFVVVAKIEQPKELLTFKIFKDSKNRVFLEQTRD